MPTYEYRCRDCGEHLEVVQSFRDDPLTECPACRGSLRKVFSAIGITFKGSGFYKTDSRSGSPGTKTGSGSGAEPSTSSSSSGGESSSSGSSGGESSSGSSSGSSPASTDAKSA